MDNAFTCTVLFYSTIMNTGMFYSSSCQISGICERWAWRLDGKS